MACTAMELHRYPNWQFSLKSLMFVTTLVAVCAALVQIALPLAVAIIPLIGAAWVRTVLVVARPKADNMHHGPPRLVATFCYSLWLIVAMILLCLATITLAGIAAMLIAMTIAGRVLKTCSTRVWPVAKRAGQLALTIWCGRREIYSRLKPGPVLDWLRVWAVAGTLALVSASCRLFRQYWCGASPAGLVASESCHGTTRTDPL
jgi:hypothetical protein